MKKKKKRKKKKKYQWDSVMTNNSLPKGIAAGLSAGKQSPVRICESNLDQPQNKNWDTSSTSYS